MMEVFIYDSQDGNFLPSKGMIRNFNKLRKRKKQLNCLNSLGNFSNPTYYYLALNATSIW